MHTDWLILTVILCFEVRESSSLYVHDYIIIFPKAKSFQHDLNASRTTIPVWLCNIQKRLL